ncbi:MAG TPA: hypothetical protein VHO91_23085 [Rhodopila sp.]|nr:hypothetical protein [Rhodopila sp.]
MKRGMFDFDVITDPVEPRSAPKPAPKPETTKTQAPPPAESGK